MVQHYLQLLRHYRWLALAVIVAVSALTAASSALLLAISPLYTAMATIAVVPTQAEYSFGSEVSRGPAGTARVLTATYIEYLKSRPVVERALEKLSPQMGDKEGPSSALASFVAGWSRFARRVYRIVDSGRYVPTDAREAMVQRLMDAVTLEKVEDSYLIRIRVSLSNPRIAAAAADALAEAYVQTSMEHQLAAAGEIGGFLREQIALREEEMNALRSTEERLKAGVGAASLEEERESVMRARESERQKLMDAQAELEAASVEVKILSTQDLVTSGRTLTDLSAARARAASRRGAAAKNFEMRKKSLADLSSTLEVLKGKEEPLLAVQRRFEEVKQDLAELRTRMLTTDLIRTSGLTRVRVIDPAVVPPYPSSPRLVRNTALGLVAGVLLSLMLVVLADTVSETVKTTADLERITGHRSLGLLPRWLFSQPKRPSRAKAFQSRLSLWGAELERGLTMVSTFDAAVIQVTGFVNHRRLAEVGSALGAALASRGRKVVRRLPDSAPGDAREVSLSEQERDASPHVVRVKCLHPISADLSFREAARISPALVCVVPVGEVPERDVRSFQDRALESGIASLSFVLLRS